MTTEELNLAMKEFYDYWRTKAPGKYWKLPANKKQFINDYLTSPEYIAMVKYDGYWARTIVGETGILIQSRGISTVTKTYGDYTPLIPHIAEEVKLSIPPGTVLLGEACYPNDLSRKATDVGKILRCHADKAIERQKVEKDKLHMRYFDILAYEYQDVSMLPFEERLALLEEVVGIGTYIDMAEVADDAQLLLQNVWNAGGEGIILVNRSLPYKFGGAQAWHSIKVKRELGELEGKVIGVLEPTRIYEGRTDLDMWPYWCEFNAKGTRVATWPVKNGGPTEEDQIEAGLGLSTQPVTKPYYHGWKSGVIVEYKGRTIKMSSGTTDDDGAYLASDAAKKLIEDGKLHAVFTGMEMTPDSVRHPNLIRLRDDM